MTFTASPPGSSLSGDRMGLLDDAIREHLELKRRTAPIRTRSNASSVRPWASRPQAEFAGPGEEEPATAEGEEEPVAEAAEPVDAGDEREPFEGGEEREPFDVESLEPVERAPQAPEPGEPAGAPGYDEDPWLEEERDEVPADEALDRPASRPRSRARTYWRTPRTSSRRRPSTTGCGSSRSLRATSTGTSSRAGGRAAAMEGGESNPYFQPCKGRVLPLPLRPRCHLTL